MNYYIILAKKENNPGISFDKIFVDNHYQPVVYLLLGKIIICKYYYDFLYGSVHDSRGENVYGKPNKYYHRPRKLTEDEYIELFNILL